MDDTVAVFSIVGGIATIVTAYAAVAALNLWRKQIAGASHHELAKKLSAALWQVSILRAEVLEHLGWLRELDEEADQQPTAGEARWGAGLSSADEARLTPYYEARLRKLLLEGKRLLHKAVDEVQALEGQVAVQWGDAMRGIVELIRSESFKLVTAVEIELVGDDLGQHYPDATDAEIARLAFSTPNTVAPTFTGGAYAKATALYTDLAQQWLAVHLGRRGARAMDEQELVARRKQVDDEVARLAEPERLAIERKRAASGSPAPSA